MSLLAFCRDNLLVFTNELLAKLQMLQVFYEILLWPFMSSLYDFQIIVFLCNSKCCSLQMIDLLAIWKETYLQLPYVLDF